MGYADDDSGKIIGLEGLFLYQQEVRDAAFGRIDDLFRRYGLLESEEPEYPEGTFLVTSGQLYSDEECTEAVGDNFALGNTKELPLGGVCSVNLLGVASSWVCQADGSLAVEWYNEAECLTVFDTPVIVNGECIFVASQGMYALVEFETDDCVPTEEPETDCSDCVTQEQYNELYMMVEAQEATISSLQTALENYGALEATVDTVETQLTNLATCLSYDSGYEPTEEPETPETTTARARTTAEPTEVETEAPSTYSMAEDSLQGVTCESGANRSFKVATDSAEECALRCEATEGCMYFSRHTENGQCIGCDIEPSLANNFTPAYETYAMTARRRLSELELLRAENEALKAALERARRN